MALDWRGPEVVRSVERAAKRAINAVMSDAVREAKDVHPFVTRSGDLERSVRIVKAARRVGDEIIGEWGSVGTAYGRRIELGFQGVDSLGRAVDAPPYPFLRPAAEKKYPELRARIRREFARTA